MYQGRGVGAMWKMWKMWRMHIYPRIAGNVRRIVMTCLIDNDDGSRSAPCFVHVIEICCIKCVPSWLDGVRCLLVASLFSYYTIVRRS